ncbi:MAG: 1-(5-phosphoribosyl)-5-[(5-phosphoribosylamino)methylideneamino]imidazole-4-carboxamide isomerase [Deltaproteobacteria bacterium]|nr:1-(5-phosphoribosyl)-5-[(5-phosphoribosylamino)methylideneamino]imidazole-4-carboxamide isomerase [Deltaproteobacteria bacterium]
MDVIPAVDIKGGKCVRLEQGRMDAETVFSEDPVAMARQWAAAGARIIHIIDLDGAVMKRPKNLALVKEIVASVETKIQIGGGIRTRDTIAMYLEAGAERVIIGTEAIRNPSLVDEACREFPGRIVVGIDSRKGMVAIEGWTEDTRTKAVDLARRFENSGVAAINFTDIHRDGMQAGPNIDETRKMAEAVSIPIIASGGVATIEDIKNLMPLEPLGVTGVITGKALYSGSLDLKEAIALATKGG